MKRLAQHALFWPAITLALLLVASSLFNPSFLTLTWRDGHLYGSVIDILNRAAPLIVVSLGMTLVIAVRGLDISVGAVVAIAAAVAALMIGGSFSATGEVRSDYPLWLALATALAVAAACGLWNGLLVVKAGHAAHRRHAHSHGGRARHRAAAHRRPDHHRVLPAVLLARQRFPARPAGGVVDRGVAVGRAALRCCRVPRSGCSCVPSVATRRRRASPAYALRPSRCACTPSAASPPAVAGLIVSSNVKSADANNAGQLLELDAILAVTLGGTALTGGRFTLAGTVIGALIIQTLTSMIYSLGVPPEVNLVVKAALVFAVMLLQSAEFRQLVARSRTWERDMNRRLLPLTITVALFVAMAAFGAIRYDGFLSPQVFLNLLIDNAFLCIVAVGMTFVILSGGIDLSVGAVIALTTMISATLLDAGWNPYAAMAVVLVLGAAFGALQGFLIQRFNLAPFIVTLAGMFMARGCCYLISTESIPIDDATYAAIAQARIPVGLGASLTIGGLIALAVVGGRDAHRALERVRPHGVCHRRRRIVRAPHGPVGGFHQDRRLSTERRMRGARRHRHDVLHALRLQPARRGPGARRHRRRGHRRHAAGRRRGLRGRHVVRRADSRHHPDPHRL